MSAKLTEATREAGEADQRASELEIKSSVLQEELNKKVRINA